MSDRRQALGLEAAPCPLAKRQRSGGEKRKAKNRLPQTLLVYFWDAVAKAAVLVGRCVLTEAWRLPSDAQAALQGGAAEVPVASRRRFRDLVGRAVCESAGSGRATPGGDAACEGGRSLSGLPAVRARSPRLAFRRSTRISTQTSVVFPNA